MSSQVKDALYLSELLDKGQEQTGGVAVAALLKSLLSSWEAIDGPNSGPSDALHYHLKTCPISGTQDHKYHDQHPLMNFPVE